MKRTRTSPEPEAAPRPAPTRLWADGRRRSLVDAAAKLMADDGVDAVRIPEVAAAAGVTRPVVYKHFANRQALIIGVLEDFRQDLDARFESVLAEGPDLDGALEGVLGAMCDAIEEKGAGAWRLLGSSGPDSEIEAVAAGIRNGMVDPWLERISGETGARGRPVRAIAHMGASVGRGMIDLWIAGELDRDQAVGLGIRGVRALIREFSDGRPRKRR